MNILYTEEQLIQFYYGECEILDSLEIENEIQNFITLNQRYSEISDQLQILNTIKFTPKQSSIDKILAYAS